jgi:uncharacterized membrane protein YqjE
MPPTDTPRRQPARGLLASLPHLLDTLIELVQTRVALVANEFEEERERLRELVLYGFWSLFFLSMGLILGTLFVIVAFWDEYRLHALGIAAGLYLLLGTVTVLRLRHGLQNRPRVLSATLAELRKDRAELREAP